MLSNWLLAKQLVGETTVIHFMPSRKYAFSMSLFQSSLLNKAEDLFMDVTCAGNDFFPYLLNIVTLNAQTLVYNAFARVLCSKQDNDKVSSHYAHFANGFNLKSILVDIDNAQYKGFKQGLSEELVRKVI